MEIKVVERNMLGTIINMFAWVRALAPAAPSVVRVEGEPERQDAVLERRAPVGDVRWAVDEHLQQNRSPTHIPMRRKDQTITHNALGLPRNFAETAYVRALGNS